VSTTNTITNPGLRRRLLTVAAYVGSARDLKDVARGLTSTVFDLLSPCRAYCVFYDPSASSLWSEAPDREWDAKRGVVGHAARHGWSLALDAATEHPDFDAAVDDPDDVGVARMLVQPIASSDGDIHALLVVVRRSDQPVFEAGDRSTCRLVAEYIAPMLSHLAIVEEAAINAELEDGSMFRAEAVADHKTGGQRGDLVRVTPAWLAPAGWTIITFLCVALFSLAFAEVDHYSTGFGIVRAGDRVSLVCRESGTLEEVHAQPGDSVVAGQLLAHLDSRDLQAELARLDAELNGQLRNRMLDPSDASAGRGVLTLRGQLEVARSRIATREVRAPHDGVVVDVRARPGQACRPGDTVLTMSRPAGKMELIALLPGDDRPQIEPGSMLRFQLPGYRHEHQWFEVTEIDDAVLGPSEVARLLGPDAADLVPRTGASVVVRAAITEASFVANGVTYAYHDGMYGEAEVRLRREPLLNLLVPGQGGR